MEEMICRRAKSLVQSEREDASGDREDGEEDDDEVPCVIGESEGDCVILSSYLQSCSQLIFYLHHSTGCMTSVPPAGSHTKLQCSFSICSSDISEVNSLTK